MHIYGVHCFPSVTPFFWQFRLFTYRELAGPKEGLLPSSRSPCSSTAGPLVILEEDYNVTGTEPLHPTHFMQTDFRLTTQVPSLKKEVLKC